MPVVNPGIRRLLASAIQRLFNGASFSAPLTHSLVPERGTGSPTFTRATTATVRDHEGVLRTAIAGEARFEGARRVRNLVAASESVAGWTNASGFTVSATQFTATATAGFLQMPFISGLNTKGVFVWSMKLACSAGDGSIAVTSIDASDGSDATTTVLALTSTPTRYSGIADFSASSTFSGSLTLQVGNQGAATNTVKTISITEIQIEDITGRADQTTPSEYVSVGALDYRSDMDPLYLSLPGTAGHYASTPDSVVNSLVASFAGIAYLAASDYSPGSSNPIFGKRASGNSFQHVLDSAGKIHLYWWEATVLKELVSSVAVPATDGLGVWIKYDVSFSAGTATGDFYYAAANGDPSTVPTFTTLGTQQTVASNSIDDTASALYVGADGSGGVFSGKIYRAMLYKAGVLVADFNPHRDATTPTGTITSSTTGEVWTINGASSVVRSAAYHGSAADGVRAYPYDLSGNPIPSTTLLGYQAEGARTNLCLQSNAFTTTWTLDGLTPVQDAIGPDGATSAWTFTDNSAVAGERIYQSAPLLTAAAYTLSVFIKKTTGAQTGYPVIDFYPTAGTANFAGMTVDTTNGIATAWTARTGFTMASGISANCVSYNDSFWRVSLTVTGTASNYYVVLYPAGTTNPTQSTGALDATAQGSAVFYGAQVELGSFASSYIPTTTIAVARNADVEAVSTSGNIAAAAGSVYLEYTPTHSPSGTIAFWGTYVDASNYTAIIHDATNLIFRKRIAGVNYDATIANAFVSGTTYKACATWGASGTSITLNGTEGTPHANTTAAQIAATMQWGADGNSLQQPFASVRNGRDWLRQLSSSERRAITA